MVSCPGFLPRIKYGVTFFRRNDGDGAITLLPSRLLTRRKPYPIILALRRC